MLQHCGKTMAYKCNIYESARVYQQMNGLTNSGASLP